MGRIPCSSHLGEYAATLIGSSIAEYLHSAELMALAHAEAFRLIGQDAVTVGPDICGIAEAMGAGIRFSDKERPQVSSPAANSLKEAAGLEPPEPESDGRLPLYLEAMERLQDLVGGAVRVGSGVSGPFTTACLVRGTDTLMMDLSTDPEGVHALLETSTSGILDYMEACMRRGAPCSMGDPLAACDVIGPELFRAFVKPYLYRISARVTELTGGGPSLHICGDVLPVLEDIAETGVAGIKVDETVDLAEAVAAVGDRLALSGNISPVAVLLKGSPSVVCRAAEEAINKGRKNPRGFVLAAGCTVALGTPLENLQALVRTTRTYGGPA